MCPSFDLCFHKHVVRNFFDLYRSKSIEHYETNSRTLLNVLDSCLFSAPFPTPFILFSCLKITTKMCKEFWWEFDAVHIRKTLASCVHNNTSGKNYGPTCRQTEMTRHARLSDPTPSHLSSAGLLYSGGAGPNRFKGLELMMSRTKLGSPPSLFSQHSIFKSRYDHTRRTHVVILIITDTIFLSSSLGKHLMYIFYNCKILIKICKIP